MDVWVYVGQVLGGGTHGGGVVIALDQVDVVVELFTVVADVEVLEVFLGGVCWLGQLLLEKEVLVLELLDRLLVEQLLESRNLTISGVTK